jgi:hypothetical protein
MGKARKNALLMIGVAAAILSVPVSVAYDSKFSFEILGLTGVLWIPCIFILLFGFAELLTNGKVFHDKDPLNAPDTSVATDKE